ncbi:MAG: acyl-CoA dehydrogenase family protein [bacterium]|nr:acyl-CoA dehydrogenase family protein [bacterium]MCY4104839.1 acyl-CoA dehydrogenase family protein [bacterium]
MAFLELPQIYKDVQAEARAVGAQVAPFAAEADECSEVHGPTLAVLRASGLSELMVPAAYGGRFEKVDPLAVCVAREVCMKASAHLDALLALQGLGSYAIAIGGSETQRRLWLPRVASGESLAAIALTEPEAGSDLKAITTTLRPSGTGDDELVVSGRKSFISNAPVADFFTTLVREPAPEGSDEDMYSYSVVLVPADSPGVQVSPSPEVIAPHVLGEIDFDDVAISADHRLGEPGSGFAHVLATLSVFRSSLAGAAVGLMEGALEIATRHAVERQQFGRPLARLGAVANLLADSWTDLESSRLLAYRAADMARQDPGTTLDYSSMAKLAATDAAARVVDRCVQIMGRWGLIKGSRIEQYYRQARPMRIYEGASEILRLGVASRLCREIVEADAKT